MSLPTLDLGGGAALRPWRADDAPRLSSIADDLEVWRHMSDRFPHPYTLDVAQFWVERGHVEFGGEHFAIALDGTLVGGGGLQPGSGEDACNVEIGYWLARGAWGRGIATRVAGALARRALGREGITRVFAGVHADNPASMQVLRKNGFQREGLLRLSTLKAGRAIDRVLWARYADDAAAQPG